MYNYDMGSSYHYLLDREDGGPGSGNWGHAGVKGQRGGSAPGGGSKNRTGTAESGYSSRAKEEKFRRTNKISTGHGNIDIDYDSVKEGSMYGMNIKRYKAMYQFSDGSGNSTRKMDKATVYETPDGKMFIFKNGMSKKKQEMTPERAIQLYQKVPKEVRMRAQDNIEFVDYYNPEDSYWRKKYANFTQSYATGGKDSITYYRCDWHSDKYFVESLSHEIGHKIDRDLGTDDRFCNSTKWTSAMQKDEVRTQKKSPTSYGENSNAEDFAESIMLYSKSPSAFERDFEYRYKVLKEVLND